VLTKDARTPDVEGPELAWLGDRASDWRGAITLRRGMLRSRSSVDGAITDELHNKTQLLLTQQRLD
jgi:hypothetical protein